MVRSREWHTHIDAAVQFSDGFTLDLLQGTPLAAAGTTIQRCLGSLSARVTAGSDLTRPVIIWGVLVGAEPTTDPLLPGSIDDHDWLFVRSVVAGVDQPATGEIVVTHPADVGTVWDVEGQRILGAGDSAWLAATLQFEDDTGTQRFDMLTVRVLGLLPD